MEAEQKRQAGDKAWRVTRRDERLNRSKAAKDAWARRKAKSGTAE